MPDTLSRLIAQASVVVGGSSFVSANGFLWVDDANVREMLRTRRQTADLFIDPSPPGGLLIQPSVDLDRLDATLSSAGGRDCHGRKHGSGTVGAPAIGSAVIDR